MELPIPPQPWLHPEVDVRASRIDGQGLFARVPLAAGVVVVRLGGQGVCQDEQRALNAAAEADASYVDTVTIAADRHLVLPPDTPVHYGNHSCDPTMWHVDQFAIATRHPVAAEPS